MPHKAFDKKIVIFGGAFNPPHVGHAAVIENVIRLFPCDEVWILPSADRHDKQISVRGEDRIKMLEIMSKECFSDTKIPIIVSDSEIKRGIMTTTLDTKLELEKKYPTHDFYWVLGSDIAADIKDKWHRGKELFDNANFIITKRAGIALPKELPRHSFLLIDKHTASIEVSSTFIRRLLARGFSGLPYITKGVAEYIKANRLYR